MKTKGFTLIELMIVVAIVGIVLSVAIPGIMKLFSGSNADVDRGVVTQRQDCPPTK